MNIETLLRANVSAGDGGGRKRGIMSNYDRKEKSEKAKEPKEGSVEYHG